MNRLGKTLLIVFVLTNVSVHADEKSSESTARRMFLRGDYSTAIAAYEQSLSRVKGPERSEASAGLSEVYAAIGEYEEALGALAQGVKEDPDNVDLWGRMAQLQFVTGDWEAAQKSAENAVRRDSDALRGRLVLAHLHRESGRLDKALEGYRWFVRYYNRKQPRDAVSLRLVAEGSLEYARWKGVSSVFHFVINTLCPDALEDDPLDWRSAVLSGDVLLEKYNEPQATPEYEAALELNALAAEAHAGLATAAWQRHEIPMARDRAMQALEINPRLVPALLILAKIEIDAEDAAAARQYVDVAIEVNRRDQRTLACLAMCQLLEDGLPNRERLKKLLSGIVVPDSIAPEESTRFEALLLQVVGQTPKPGLFLNELGEFFDARQKYGLAESAYRAAVEVMPQLAAAKTNLGLLDMRIGKISEADEILSAAFKSDPFHVRVSNMRKVIDVLNGYDTLRTEHFVVRVDRSERMLGEYMAEYLEELHAELSETYGYSPATPTQFEVYSSARGQTAHQWFSARMVGLPWIQTIGASTGMIVALASPQAIEEPFNWGRVLRHEYVHILTLQQTDFNIPHWYTEALAVRTEGVELNEEWKKLLIRRVPAGEVFNLKTINDGFRQPEGPDDWNMAYCQSRQYARFLELEWGEQALMQLRDAYGRGLGTDAAIPQVTGLSLDEFEEKYTAYLMSLVEELQNCQVEPEIDLAAARAAWEADPFDGELSGRYAYALWKNGDELEARGKAEETLLDLQPGNPLATVILLSFADEEGEEELATALIEEAHNPDEPHALLLSKIAERAFNNGEVETSVDYFRLGLERFPWEDTFRKGLAVAYLSRNDHDRALPLMEELANNDPENVTIRVHLAKEFLDAEDFGAARRWAREILFLDLEDPEAHYILGKCWLAGKDWAKCRDEFDRTLAFDPEHVGASVGLARCEYGEGNVDRALNRLEALLSEHPEHEEARSLRETWRDERR